MTTYSTWERYSEDFGGQLPRETYLRLAVDAKFEIDRLTFGRAESAPDTMTERLSRCECAMVDAMGASENIGLTAGVSSVNNDGISIGFEANAKTAFSRQLESIARKYLTMPINLMFSGAVVRNV